MCDIDNKPILLKDKLQKKFPNIYFEIISTITDIDLINEKVIYIIDTVVGISKITIFDDIYKFVNYKKITTHDLDIGTMLQIMYKIKYIKKIYIIGIPVNKKLNDIYKKLIHIIMTTLHAKNV